MFYALSYKLNEYLKSKGFSPIVDDKSREDGTCFKKDGMGYWRYIKNRELNTAIEEYNDNRIIV